MRNKDEEIPIQIQNDDRKKTAHATVKENASFLSLWFNEWIGLQECIIIIIANGSDSLFVWMDLFADDRIHQLLRTQCNYDDQWIVVCKCTSFLRHVYPLLIWTILRFINSVCAGFVLFFFCGRGFFFVSHSIIMSSFSF